MKTQIPEVLTKELRTTLKQLFARELEQLPDYLKDLEPKERLDYLLKLMPYVFPKVENVRHRMGEPDEFKINEWHI